MNRQLSVSCGLIQNQKCLQKLIQQLVRSQQCFLFTENHCECNHQKGYRKLKTFCTGNPKEEILYRVNIWLEEDIVSPALMDNRSYHIVIREVQGKEIIFDGKNVIVILDVQEVGDILSLSIFQMEKRCKMEYLMRKSHKRYKGEEFKIKFKDLCLKYMQIINRKGVKALIGFSRFYCQKKLDLLRKHFTVWRICLLEGNLSSLNEQLISRQYFCQVQNKNTLAKYFQAWKQYYSSAMISS